jgi:hypothetical protein
LSEPTGQHHAARHFQVSVSLPVNLMKAYYTSGRLAPKPSGKIRHAKGMPSGKIRHAKGMPSSIHRSPNIVVAETWETV